MAVKILYFSLKKYCLILNFLLFWNQYITYLVFLFLSMFFWYLYTKWFFFWNKHLPLEFFHLQLRIPLFYMKVLLRRVFLFAEWSYTSPRGLLRRGVLHAAEGSLTSRGLTRRRGVLHAAEGSYTPRGLIRRGVLYAEVSYTSRCLTRRGVLRTEVSYAPSFTVYQFTIWNFFSHPLPTHTHSPTHTRTLPKT